MRAVVVDTLTGSKYVGLYAEENLSSRLRERFETLQAINLETGRPWAERYWKRWYFWATHRGSSYPATHGDPE